MQNYQKEHNAQESTRALEFQNSKIPRYARIENNLPRGKISLEIPPKRNGSFALTRLILSVFLEYNFGQGRSLAA